MVWRFNRNQKKFEIVKLERNQDQVFAKESTNSDGVSLHEVQNEGNPQIAEGSKDLPAKDFLGGILRNMKITIEKLMAW